MSDANATNTHESTELLRAIDWKQGLVIAMGIPILIVPSLCDLSMDLWGMSIIIWVLSVLSGFLINLPLGEMCATFGVAGVGGSIQHVFKDDEKYRNKKINGGRMLGSFGAWCYFATWVPVIPIFTIATGVYINDYFKLGLEGFTATLLYLALGVLIYGFIIIVGRRGLEGGAKTQLALSIITIIPILAICLVPLATGAFHISYITDQMIPPAGSGTATASSWCLAAWW